MKAPEAKIPTKEVGIWIRVSTEEQAEGDSPEHHEKRARYYAESKDWNVVDVYSLEAVSGKAVWDQPETKRMLADIKSGRITGLIFSKLARLARNTRELLDFADVFREQGADLISLQESIDTSSPAGRLFYTLIAAMAQWEREEIADRVAASVPIRAKLGKSLGGQAPYGYRWQDKKEFPNPKMVPDPKEAPVRRLIHELFVKHQQKRTVARVLNESGYRSRTGGKFTGTTVARILEDPTAKGTRRANYTKSTGDKRKWKLKPETDWIFIEVEPIISEDLWNECQAIMAKQRNGRAPRRRPAVHLFAGVTRCHCGPKMYVPTKMTKYVCPKCRNKIAMGDLETVFQEQLREFVMSPDQMLDFASKTDHGIKKQQDLAETLEREQKTVSGEMDKLYRLYMADGITPEGFKRQYRPLEERLAQLEDEIPRIQAEIDFLKIQQLSSGQVAADIQDLYTHWPNLEHTEKRSIIEGIVDEIIIGREEVLIELNYMPAPPNKSLTARIQSFSASQKLLQKCDATSGIHGGDQNE